MCGSRVPPPTRTPIGVPPETLGIFHAATDGTALLHNESLSTERLGWISFGNGRHPCPLADVQSVELGELFFVRSPKQSVVLDTTVDVVPAPLKFLEESP